MAMHATLSMFYPRILFSSCKSSGTPYLCCHRFHGQDESLLHCLLCSVWVAHMLLKQSQYSLAASLQHYRTYRAQNVLYSISPCLETDSSRIKLHVSLSKRQHVPQHVFFFHFWLSKGVEKTMICGTKCGDYESIAVGVPNDCVRATKQIRCQCKDIRDQHGFL